MYGFRKPNEPWIYYFASLFQPHNETLNMWTHLIGMILVIMRGGSMLNAEGRSGCLGGLLLRWIYFITILTTKRDFSWSIELVFLFAGASLTKDPFYWPLLSGLVAIFIMYLLSTVAHTFQSRSEIAHYVFFMCDYGGKACSIFFFWISDT